MTLFHVIQLTCAIFFLVSSFSINVEDMLWLRIFLGICAFILGWFIGNLPFLLSFWHFKRQIRNTSTTDLHQNFGKQFAIGHILITELMVRGENLDQEILIIRQKLVSENLSDRRIAWECLNFAAPEAAKQLQGYDPLADPELCQQFIQNASRDTP